jgi:hypothetical protein
VKRAAISLAVLAVCSLFVQWIIRQPRRAPTGSVPHGINISHAPVPCLTYPHALVKCGVWSMEDVEASRKDPLVAEHYRDIGIVRSAVLKADEWDYVSFRGDTPNAEPGKYLRAGRDGYVWTSIVWTPRPILIHAGELILEDRAGNRIRARCGNRLSAVPREPKAFVMPPEMEHEVPTVTMPDEAPLLPPVSIQRALLPVPDLVAFAPPADELPVSPLGPFLPSLIPPMVGVAAIPPAVFLPGGPPVVIGRGPIRGTPEPMTLWLFFAALVLIAAWRKI